MSGKRRGLWHTLRRLLVWVASLAGLAAAYLLFWPTPLDPFAWTPAQDPGTGPGSPFRPTQAMERVDELGRAVIEARFRAAGSPVNFGPEDVAVGPHDGRVYTGLGDGSVLRIDPDTGETEVFANTGGRPLGMAFDATGDRLYVADGHRGLVAIDRAGKPSYLVEEVGGEPLSFADNLDVAPDGTVWFSSPGRVHALEQVELDVWDSRPSGRLLRYDPRTGRAQVVLDNLFYANGVAVAADGAFVLVAEFLAYRVRRYWLAGPRAGAHDLFADNLPGYPDNITLTPGGTFLVGLSLERIPGLDAQRPRPWAVKALYRLPGFLKPAPRYPGYLLEFAPDSRLLRFAADERPGMVAQVTAGTVLPPGEESRGGRRVALGSLLVPAVRTLELE